MGGSYLKNGHHVPPRYKSVMMPCGCELAVCVRRREPADVVFQTTSIRTTWRVENLERSSKWLYFSAFRPMEWAGTSTRRSKRIGCYQK